jgi:hypothetical protein
MGRVSDPEGAAFSGAFVQLKNESTNVLLNAVSGKDGLYQFGEVAAGKYELTVNVPGMDTFRRPGTVVKPGERLRLDAKVEDGPALRTLGEDPVAIAALYINRPPPPEGAAPRTADGKPDLSGSWLLPPSSLDKAEMLPAAAALQKSRMENHAKDHPMVRCLPAGPLPLLGAGWFQIVQSPATLIMLLEDETPGFRAVYLDGRAHPRNFGPTWLGHSVGKWEGDQLVVDSVGFGDEGWLDYGGYPYSARLHVTQRFRRVDLGHLGIEITVDDPGAYAKPFSVTKTATLGDLEIQEYICNENNRDVPHMVGK